MSERTTGKRQGTHKGTLDLLRRKQTLKVNGSSDDRDRFRNKRRRSFDKVPNSGYSAASGWSGRVGMYKPAVFVEASPERIKFARNRELLTSWLLGFVSTSLFVLLKLFVAFECFLLRCFIGFVGKLAITW